MKIYWEVCILEDTRGDVAPGFAGSNLPIVPVAALLGDNAFSWSVYSDNGQRIHRS